MYVVSSESMNCRLKWLLDHPMVVVMVSCYYGSLFSRFEINALLLRVMSWLTLCVACGLCVCVTWLCAMAAVSCVCDVVL